MFSSLGVLAVAKTTWVPSRRSGWMKNSRAPRRGGLRASLPYLLMCAVLIARCRLYYKHHSLNLYGGS